MSVKKYGIYIAYPPSVKLEKEGLGRHLIEFLKASQHRSDVSFVIACPSWMKASLIDLLQNCNIKKDAFQILAPQTKPLLLICYELYIKFQQRKKISKRSRYFKSIKFLSYCEQTFEKLIATTRSKFVFAIALFIGFFMVVMQVLFKRIYAFICCNNFAMPFVKNLKYVIIQNMMKVVQVVKSPQNNSRIFELFQHMRNREYELMNQMIDSRDDISAWYCPTAFWPEFNNISKPRLMCVPDVVLNNFPIAYALAGTDRMLDNFMQVEQAIENGQYFVTYSEDVKWKTLVRRYHVDPEKIFVSQHGANSLKEFITLSGPTNNETTQINWCYTLLRIASAKYLDRINKYLFVEGSHIKFIFYASQFRPNKNIISLLRAYDYLLKRKYITHKLILTGNQNVSVEIDAFIKSHNLQSDVLCFYDLSVEELAACYKLADLAVNPSLSEGGCPFTFTEALSVDTPVVMANIPVTLEVITDPELVKEMLFDPYDWKDIADKIEWGLQNKEALLMKQKRFYDVLKNRSWETVVNEYIAILDKISQQIPDNKAIKSFQKPCRDTAVTA